MKTALLVLVLLLLPGMCYAQTPNTKKNDGLCIDASCLQTPFPYWFCDKDGNQVFKCSSNPNNEPGLKFMKIKIPIEFEYDAWSLNPLVTGGDDIIDFYETWQDTTDLRPYPVFINANMQSIIAAAAERWMAPGLCPPQGPDSEYVNCKIKIRWSFSNDELPLGKVRGTPAVTRRAINPAACSLHCPQSLIILNQQPDHLRFDEFGRPTHFLLTERENHYLTQLHPNEEYVYLDAYTTMLHEFGHLLGFDHTDEAGCGDRNGIMKSTWLSGETGDLSAYDECMFLKAYCCQKTRTITYYDDPNLPPDGPPYNGTKNAAGSIGNNGTGGAGFSIVPNPVTSGVIKLAIYGVSDARGAVLRVVDASGAVMLSRNIPDGRTLELSLDASSLSTGMYMLQLIHDGQTFGRKFLVAE